MATLRSSTRMMLAAIFAALVVPVPAQAETSGFVLVNSSGGALQQLSARRVGSDEWRPIAAAPANGARGNVDFKDPDCAFDLRASVEGAGEVTWAGVNLCDVKSVVLRRDESAGAWVDYDE